MRHFDEAARALAQLHRSPARTRTAARKRRGPAPRSDSSNRSRAACRSTSARRPRTASGRCRSGFGATRSPSPARSTAAAQEFLLDTGAERTVISLDVARRRGVLPITSMQTAGVGGVGLRGLEVGRIDTLEIGGLKVRNVPCLIKNPPLGGLPAREPESFSPLALGLSMRIDYERRQLTIAAARSNQPTTPTSCRCGCIVWRSCAGTVNGRCRRRSSSTRAAKLISISDATAGQIQPATPFRRIPLRVYGTSGWDKDAFLMPDVDLEFSTIRFTRIPVVVLNLRAPSALLGLSARRNRRAPVPEQVSRDDRHDPQRRGAGGALAARGSRLAAQRPRLAGQ